MVKDYTYAVSFDKKDYLTLQTFAKKVRITHDQNLVNDFNNFLEARWNDKRHLDFRGMEPWQVSKSNPDDIVTYGGFDQIIRQIQRTSTVRWQYMARGVGTSGNPYADDTAMIAENTPRIDMAVNGWREYASSSLRFLAIHGETLVTQSIVECGIFTAATGGIMLNHVDLSNFPLVHTINTSVFVISCIIEFVPIV